MNRSFSIIVPVYNSQKYIDSCIKSLIAQEYNDYEIIIVNDCSTDSSVEIIEAYAKAIPNLTLINTDKNSGPGIARNSGIHCASEDWIIFLDSDDELTADCLSSLNRFIEEKQEAKLSAVGFDWASVKVSDSLNSSKREGRRDGNVLGNRDKLIHESLSHRMDGSVIYTAINREFIKRHNLYFESGIHEDVDYIFSVYYYAEVTAFLPKKLYIKRNHAESIVNNISKAHVEGYFRAWRKIGSLISPHLNNPLESKKYHQSFSYGVIGAIATRVREVIRHGEVSEILLASIYTNTIAIADEFNIDITLNDCNTVYCLITKNFIEIMNSSSSSEDKCERIYNMVDTMAEKSWSCVDLHHSLFMRPEQIRTCCKRFFVDGEMKGDVVLFDVDKESDETISAHSVLKAKQDLHQKINSGVPNSCDGCPFLEFKEWSPLNKLDIKYLSLEYHSVCNLECSYCDEEYYNGRKSSYSIRKTIDQYIDTDVLDNCSIVVWGGGEPVIDSDFDYLMTNISNKVPSAQQRVLTNAVKLSDVVKETMSKKKAHTITSIDAGSYDVFTKVRGRNSLKNVCKNIKEYANVDVSRVTVKYIFTEGNGTIEDIRNFVQLMDEYELLQCIFQISSDFKNEKLSDSAVEVMMILYGLLRKNGSNAIYFDELLWHRLVESSVISSVENIKDIHVKAGFEFIASPDEYPQVVVWGAGQQAKYLMNKSTFFKQVDVAYFVDATPEKVGTTFFDKEIKETSSLQDDELPVVIAAVQGYPLILEQYKKMGFLESRIIRKLII